MGPGHLHPGDCRHLRSPQTQDSGLGRPAFDRHRYDYRKALVEFGRGLSSETDLEALLASIVERLPRTLLVARVAVFLMQDSGQLRLAAVPWLARRSRCKRLVTGPEFIEQEPLALGFLDFDHATDHSHIFLENAQQALHLPPNQRRTAALLDLNYYLPCRVRRQVMDSRPRAPSL